MSIDQNRNINFSAYIEYDFFSLHRQIGRKCTQNIPPISCWFFSPHVAFALEAFVHLYAAAKNVLFSIQSKRTSVNLGTLQVFDFLSPNPLWNLPYLIVWKHERIYMEEIWKSEKNVWKCEGFLKKNENLYGKMLNSTEKCKNLNGKNMEKWRICMETWRIYKEK